MAMFQRYVAIDWSGRGSEHQPVPLAVAEVRNGEQMAIIQPPRFPKVRNWSRRECREWLGTILRPDQPRTVVALDFGLSLPWGADQGVFGCTGWGEMVQSIAKLYGIYGTARATAEAINREPKFGGHGPFRFDGSRTDFRFYLDRDVAYYRLVETAIPQAISQWYLGSGGTVGFHTLTGLAAIHELIAQREAGHVRFQVWPQECQSQECARDRRVLSSNVSQARIFRFVHD